MLSDADSKPLDGREEHINPDKSSQPAREHHKEPWPDFWRREIAEFWNREAAERQADRQHANRSHKQNLTVQWCLLFATILAVVAAAYYAHISSLQLATMRSQLEATDRPWLKVIGAKALSDLTFGAIGDQTDLAGTVAVTVQNIGRSVALNVAIHGELTIEESPVELHKKAANACSGPITFPRSMTIFPEDDTGDNLFTVGAINIPTNVDSSAASINDTPFSAPAGAKLVAPKILGCLTYMYPSSRTVHTSGFLFGLAVEEAMPNPKDMEPVVALMFKNHHGPHIARYFVVGRNVAMNDLRFQNYFSGFNAN